MTLHHTLAILLWVGAILGDKGGHFFLVAFGIGELSNPAMHLRMIVKHMGLKYTRLYEVLEIAYFTSFLFGRQLFLHPGIYNVCVCSEIHLALKLMSLTILAQSWLFTVRMTSSIKRRLAEIDERHRRGIKLSWLEPMPAEELEKCDFYKSSMKFREKLP